MIQIVLVVFMVFVFNAGASAEVFTLKSGQSVEGEIVEETESYIKVDSGAGIPLTYYKDDLEGFTSSFLGDSTSVAAQSLQETPTDKKYSDDPQINAIITQTIKTYRDMNSLRAQGEVINDMSIKEYSGKQQKGFDLILGRPVLYKITWEDKMPSGPPTESAVWNDGSGAYLLMGFKKSYEKASTDEMALGAATGISGGVANIVPSLFFGFSDLGGPFDKFKDITVLPEEEVEGEVCFHLQGKSRISNQHEFWISKKRYVIVKEKYSLEKGPADAMDEALDADEIRESLITQGLPENEENITKMKEFMQLSKEMFENIDMKGTSETLYSLIEINPTIENAQYTLQLPEGASLSESILGNKNFDALDDARFSLLVGGGASFSQEKAHEYEKALDANPEDLDKRISLLGYYMNPKAVERNTQRTKHILWLVENKPDLKNGEHLAGFIMMHPASDKNFDTVKAAWLKQMEEHPENPYVFRNAAGFFMFSDKPFAQELFQKARTIDPSLPPSDMEQMLERKQNQKQK